MNDHPQLLIAYCVLFGLAVGSFLNVVIHRLPRMMERDWKHQLASHHAQTTGEALPPEPEPYNLSVPRSACPLCGHKISALENIPVISYLWLRGKCAGCSTPISIRYPLVELLTGVIAGLVAWKFGASLHGLAAFVLAGALLTLTFIDIDTYLLPDDITLPLLWAGLLFNLMGGFTDLQSAVIGAVTGYLILWSVYWLFKLVTGKEGMGYGDFKLLAALGAWFGWNMLPVLLVLASVSAVAVAGGQMLLSGKARSAQIPFGPYLALGGISVLFFGAALSRWLGQ
jgi:leader peptidase (prepilin peptidase)/N-methyltransferase